MKITGVMLIGNSEVFGTQGTLRAFNPASGTELDPDFGAGDESDVDRACLLAQGALDSYRETSLDTRAKFLRLIAKEVLGLGEVLVDRACPDCKRISKISNGSAHLRFILLS